MQPRIARAGLLGERQVALARAVLFPRQPPGVSVTVRPGVSLAIAPGLHEHLRVERVCHPLGGGNDQAMAQANRSLSKSWFRWP